MSRRTAIILSSVFLLFLSASAFAQSGATLAVGSGSGLPGATLDIPVNLTVGSSPVGTLQFDLTFAPALSFVSVSAGTAAQGAGKDASFSFVSSGVVRVLLFGLNKNAVPSGCVAIIRLTIASGAAPGIVAVPIGGIVVSDVEGYAIPASGVNGSVAILAPADTTPPVISGPTAGSVNDIAATISWSTNEQSTSTVEYGSTTAYTNSLSDPTLTTTHSMTLSGLSAATTYHYRVLSSDTAGNKSVSADATFTTTAPQDHTAPVLTAIVVAGITSSGAAVTWNTDEPADSQVEYGTSSAYGNLTAVDAKLVASHSVSLAGLSASTTYHYRIRSRDASGNTSVSGDYTFATTAAPDTTAPVISGAAASSVDSAGATITWKTDEPSDSQVDFGTSSSYGSSTPLNATLVTAHSVTLAGLKSSTVYHFKIKSKDAAGNAAASGDLTFSTTGPNDVTPPVISAIVATKITSRGAVISWSTDELSDSQVEYGTTVAFGKANKLVKTLVASHSCAISGLKANKSYYFRVKSRDAAGNLGVSPTYAFTTTSSSGTTLSLFYPRLVSQTGSATGLLDGSEYTGFAVVNLGSSEAVLTFTAYDTQGNEISGDDITNPSAITLAPGAQLPVVDVELFGSGLARDGRIGWIKLESSATAVSGFTLMFNSSLSVLDGAPAFITPFVSSVLPEIEDEGFTQIHIANPNEDQVNVLADLVEQDGSVRATATRVVNANGVIAEYLTDLFPDTPAVAGDYIRILSGKGVIPFQMLGKPSQYLEGLNGQDTAAGAKALYSPQYAVGGPWRSTLSVVNVDASPGTVTFRLVGDDGAQIGPTRVMPVAGHGKIYLKDQAFFAAPDGGLVQGYVQITSDVRLIGSVVFGDPDRSAFAAALPLVSALQDAAIFGQVASNETYFTGLALLNPSDSEADVTLEVYGSDGNLEATMTQTIRPRQRMSKLLTQYFPQIVGQNRSSGYIRMYADKPIAAFALFGTRDLSALSAVPAQPMP